MAKVIKPFRERLHDMKRYSVGDDYPETNQDRVTYLVKEGFLAESEAPVEKKRKKGADVDGDSNA